MAKFAVLNGEIVINTIIADNKTIAEEVTGFNCVEYDETNIVSVGFVYDVTTGKFKSNIVEESVDNITEEENA